LAHGVDRDVVLRAKQPPAISLAEIDGIVE
jgi:hypothetical protein